ncbi:MAG TPA: L,D-transpeptidase/peptidoglycan binding protein [Solirubrobacteraceae bacterium]|nr:L,D-transpeptidase/peptidoglycan binding protein [Solirubrobacteraceae bacterium]
MPRPTTSTSHRASRRKRSTRATALVLVVMVLVLLAGGGVAVYAVDESQRDVIAEGVRVGAVDVGGMTVPEARDRLRATLLEPLDKPVEVRARGETFELTAEEADVRADVDGVATAALQAGRSQPLLERVWRTVSGSELHEVVDAQVRFDEEAVDKLVEEVREASDTEARDAGVDITATDVSVREGRRGIRTNAERLREDVLAAVTDPEAERSIAATFRKVEPEVTTDEVADRYGTIVIVDRGSFRLRLFKDLEEAETYPIALGKAGNDTPAGTYEIQNKAVDPAWSVPNSDWAGSLAGQVIPGGAPNNPLKARWLGIFNGVGIHGTAERGSIGTNASHGCIRMLIEDVEALYERVPVGATVYIS